MSFLNKQNILKFSSLNNDVTSKIKPAKNYIPQWYKNIKGYNYSNIEFSNNNLPIKNIKSCMPFFDSLSTGYMIELWCDIHVRIDDSGESHYLTWGQAEPTPIAFRDANTNPIPVPIGCEESQYIWKSPYCFKTPKDYSLLFTHPLNRFDLPFITLTGIIDAEKTIGSGNYPFFIKKDFEGIIEKGTPIIQIIPFKKENWISENDDVVLKEGIENSKKISNVFFGFYKKEMWNKKTYE